MYHVKLIMEWTIWNRVISLKIMAINKETIPDTLTLQSLILFHYDAHLDNHIIRGRKKKSIGQVAMVVSV